MVETPGYRVRAFHERDRSEVMALAPRLAAGIAPWRSVDGMIAAAQGWVETSLQGIGPDQAVFVAEDMDGRAIGFAAVARQEEFTGEAQAYVGERAVVESAEGAGVGQALLAAVEDWARSRNLAPIVLDTGAANVRARRFYGKRGFVEESVKLTKVLNSDR